MKKWMPALFVFLLLIPAAVFAAPDYEVILPADYENSQVRYPVLYVMPHDGFRTDDSGLTEALLDSPGMPMLVVRPTFAPDDDIPAVMGRVAADVDAKYRTVDDPACRIAVGTGVGGYLAYAVTLDDGSVFGCAVSIRGNFTGDDHPWRGALGDIREKMNAMHQGNAGIFNNYYTYMDAPVDDPWTDQPGGTDDLGSMMIGFGTGSEYHEFTVRPGAFDSAFLAESASRVMDRLTSRILDTVLSGKMTLEKAVLGTVDDEVCCGYSLDVSDAIDSFDANETSLRVTLTLVDAETGETLAQAGEDAALHGEGTYTGRLNVPNVVKDRAEARLSVTLLGAGRLLDAAPVSVAREDVLEGEHQQISLADDWHFNYTGAKQLDAAALRTADFEGWDVVQPGLASWTKGFGNISEKNVISSYGPDYFDFFIVGSGYYAKAFTLPSAFDTPEPMLVIGYVDDRCEVFLNGVRIGGTGMDEDGRSTGDTTWAVFSAFPVDPALLRRGEENTVVVRAFNDLPFGAGGWYGGPIGLMSKTAFEAQYGSGESGRFYEETFESAFAASARGQSGTVENRYLIYLPPSYAESERSYPTVFLLHQFNSDHTSYRTDGIDRLLDQGIRDGLFDEMIVVIPNSSEESWWRGDWERMITEELIPMIDKNYRTIPDPRFRLTAGCSMGGQGACAVALRNPNAFSGFISFFGAFSYGGESDPNRIAARESPEYLRSFTQYFICGNQDSYGFGVPAIALHQRLLASEVPHRFFIENGGHDSAFYLPFFTDAFGYVRANMYRADEGADTLLTGTLTLEDGVITGSIAADPAIAAYFYAIPASSYTIDPAPPLSVPLTISVVKGEETVFSLRDSSVRLSPDHLTCTVQADLSEQLGSGESVTVRLTASVFDRVVLLCSLELPAD